MRNVFIIDAKRTAVAPRGTAFRDHEALELAAPVFQALMAANHCSPDMIQAVFMGNALYGGGNPARVAALAAGIPDHVEAMTIDTQCCSGLDAIMLAATHIASGQADIVIAGGVESYSRSPIRLQRPRNADEQPEAYSRPPFTPWADRDPDMIAAAAQLAEELQIPRTAQESYAIRSHETAFAAPFNRNEIVPVSETRRDTFTRQLSPALCRRLPLLAGSPGFGQTAATIAVEADAAAAVLMVSEQVLAHFNITGHPVRYRAGRRGGGDPARPALAPIGVVQKLMQDASIQLADIAAAEVMEAFAVQAMACIDATGLQQESVNRSGGALARGHPIGASGAILAVRLWHELQSERSGAAGLSMIAAAGGLGSAVLLEKP